MHLSRWEGLPLAVVEAMAAQLPVVVTAATNVGDLVATYGAGWVVDGDPAAALRSIFNASPHERRSRGSAALRLVRMELSWSRAAADIVAALLSSPVVGDRRMGHVAGRE